jgi:nitronate monooxygenase
VSVLDELAVPIVQAPLAGGPSTPELAAAVSAAGGFGFLAAGYLTPQRLGDDIAALRTMTTAPFGVNVFVGGAAPAEPDVVAGYARALGDEARRVGVALGTPRFDDDAFDDKVDLLCGDPVAVVSFTFGLPPADAVRRLAAAGSEVWITVTSPDEAGAAVSLGADALVVQGVEAGGHRGVFVDDDSASDLTLLAALQLIGAGLDVPLVAAGGLATGAAIAAVLAAGASAAQLGTAYLRCPEAATSDVQRRAVASTTATVLTRAFTGRLARGVGNRFHAEHGADAPPAYPEVHYLTAPLRAHGRSHGDADVVNLWAGQTHELASELPAGELTRRRAADARDALAAAARRLASVPTVE